MLKPESRTGSKGIGIIEHMVDPEVSSLHNREIQKVFI
jgi:hypothetical protein